MNHENAERRSIVKAERVDIAVVDTRHQRFLAIKARSPVLAKYVATWNLRAETGIKMRNLKAQVDALTEDLELLRTQLSPEEQDFV